MPPVSTSLLDYQPHAAGEQAGLITNSFYVFADAPSRLRGGAGRNFIALPTIASEHMRHAARNRSSPCSCSAATSTPCKPRPASSAPL